MTAALAFLKALAQAVMLWLRRQERAQDMEHGALKLDKELRDARDEKLDEVERTADRARDPRVRPALRDVFTRRD